MGKLRLFFTSIISFSLIIFIFIAVNSGLVGVAEEAENHPSMVEHFGEEVLRNFADAGFAYAMAMEEFASCYTRGTSVGDFDEDKYPRRLGGIYFNDDGHLVVQQVGPYDGEGFATCEETGETRSVGGVSLADLCSVRRVAMNAEENGIITYYVDFSYNYLNEVSAVISRFLRANQDCEDVFRYISGIGTDVKNNRVRVGLSHVGEESIAWFRNNITDSPAVVFEYCPGIELGFNPEQDCP